VIRDIFVIALGIGLGVALGMLAGKVTWWFVLSYAVP
jgi:hypothetical protein